MIPSDPKARQGYFIDANLLVLLVVGRTGRDLIAKHRRLQEYTVEDFDTLANLLRAVDETYVTPNTLTEASNLLAQHAEPERSLFLENLRILIEGSRENLVESTRASSNQAFIRLGLTDAALLEVISEDISLLTVDLDLYLAALDKGVHNAVNFRRLRQY